MKQLRRAEYARTQDLWRKNRSKCLRMILNDVTGVQVPPKDIMVPLWETVMRGGEDVSPGNCRPQPVIADLWTPISPKEIKKAMPSNTTLAGPDGVSARLLKRVPHTLPHTKLNCLLWKSTYTLAGFYNNLNTKEIRR
ncbi:reverse transcriptase [Lasius niger]|uniref:Reverse transcriptase n=1 Tax=Lasius niger TaxID=67767 RepID=A0A0J7K3L8_LASNI|nr:reverse transcriptase [Lasius niger]